MVQQDIQVILAQQVQPDKQDKPALQDHQGPQAQLDKPEELVRQVLVDSQAQQVHLDKQVIPDQPDQQD